MNILKFGGSSLATPERIRHVAGLIATAQAAAPSVVVVSAMGGATDDLIAASKSAAQGPEGDKAGENDAERDHVRCWHALAERHRDAAAALAAPTERETLRAEIDRLLDELRDLLRGVELLRECSPRSRDSIISHGERLSAHLVAAALRAVGTHATAVDARALVVTNDSFGRATVEREITRTRVTARLLDPGDDGVAVVTGFIAASSAGQTTTLGRGGSDYTAALLGAALDAEAIELWTDVSGVLSADPRQVPEAFPQTHMGFAELMELSHFGAKVVYPPTVHPARESGIPLVIKNTLDPTTQGTLITEEAPPSDRLVRGIASIPHVALMRLEGDGMVGVPGIASRLFGALATRGVSVILISQASSEHSICFAVAPDDAGDARTAVDDAFALERQAGLVRALVVETDMAVVAAVGEALRDRPGVAGSVFGALGRQGISVRAIAQGSSERNISLVVAREDVAQAVRTVHRAFFPMLTPPATESPALGSSASATTQHVVRLAVCGVGRVGATLLDQLRDAAPVLRETEGLDLRVDAILNSRQSLTAGLDQSRINLDTWRGGLDAATARPSIEALIARLSDNETRDEHDGAVLVDCTASDTVASWYPRLLAAGIHVVAANKRGFSGSVDEWNQLRTAAVVGDARMLFEAAVGAGLPVLRPLHDLVRSGDRVIRIDGLLSGTIGAVLHDVDQGVAFSEAVRQAHAAGFTEPNPWDDLSGADVGRKLCILARRSGHAIEPEAIHVAPLLEGDGWAALTLDAFWDRLPEVDAAFDARRAQAHAAGQRLRYLASFDPDGGGAQAATTAVGPDHPAYGVTGPDNLIAITSDRYRDHPLVIRGPGAGPDVTAAGVFSDLLATVM